MFVGYSAAQVRAAEAPHLAAGEPLMRRAAAALAATLRGELAGLGAPDGPTRRFGWALPSDPRTGRSLKRCRRN